MSKEVKCNWVNQMYAITGLHYRCETCGAEAGGQTKIEWPRCPKNDPGFEPLEMSSWGKRLAAREKEKTEWMK